jgi:hypothetical protein
MNKDLISFLGASSSEVADNLLDLVEKFVDITLWMPPKYRMATALWITHIPVYKQFDHTPRLALLSPDPGWGKSQVLKLIQHLVPLPKPQILIDPTPAGLYQSIDAGVTACLVDEVDNLNLNQNVKLRSILNAYERGAAIPRGTSARKGSDVATPKYFRPFIPIALGAIGKLPKPLTTRCIVIHMKKKPPGVIKLRINTQDPNFVRAADIICGLIQNWASNIVLNQEPDMAGLDNRFADLWRPLFAIAEYFDRLDIVHTIAQGMVAEYVVHSDGTQLLIDTRTIFDELKIDRIERLHLLHELHKFDRWNEWGRPSPLTKNEMLSILRSYRVPEVHPIV